MITGLQHATAFVIQFRSAAQARADQLSGRVEHVATGLTANFQSLDELPQLLLEMLRRAPCGDGNGIG
jgi:hypothetical protein